jgi:hypothetical protein
MRVLLVHPEDSPRTGLWTREHWDLLIDLGRTSQFSVEDWEKQYGCPVLRVDYFRKGIADAKQVRELFSTGLGRLLDEEGVDWWDLISLLLVPDALDALALKRAAAEIDPSAELCATRLSRPINFLGVLLGRPIRSLEPGGLARSVARARHYAEIAYRFPPGQIKEIIFDKYDSGYQWRSRFGRSASPCAEPVVLVPSAYGNVSRMAAAYAQLLPRQKFLVVATRHSGQNFVPPANMVVRDLASYAKAEADSMEIAFLLERWASLKSEFRSSTEMEVLSRAGVFNPVPGWIGDGIAARNAWREVLESEPVIGVLCGDDSNRYTRLPVLLAAKRKIPTVDFHHGAFDGRYLFKSLPCDVYLAKNEMERDYLLRVCGLPAERIAIGAPAPGFVRRANTSKPQQRTSAIFFSEPYEVAGMRAEEVYRELLPPLCRMVREQGRDLIIKLHPFESRAQRCKLVREILSPKILNAENRALVTVIEGPLTEELMSQAWFGITVESTSVVDCVQNGIRCFLCGWLTLFPYEYVEQYVRFGVGEILEHTEQIAEIPRWLTDEKMNPLTRSTLATGVDPAKLQEWLTARYEPSGIRSVS